MVLMDENDKLETDKVDMISANLIREAYPVYMALIHAGQITYIQFS